MDKTIYQIRKALPQDNEWVWWDASKEAYDMHPHATRRIVYAKPAQRDAPTDADDAFHMAALDYRTAILPQEASAAYERLEAAARARYAPAQDTERVGRVDIVDGHVRTFAFEQTDIPTGSYVLHVHVAARAQRADKEAS